MSDPSLWQQVEKLFDRALEQRPAERHRFLSEATSDTELRSIVVRMLEAHEQGGGVLDRPVDLLPDFSVRTRLDPVLGDRYQLEGEIGRGGMATVFLARERKHDRQVVIKVLNPDAAAAFGSRRFLDEIRVIAKLSHPHILPLIDSGGAETSGDTPGSSPPSDLFYYVMPYLGGETLRARLHRGGALPLDSSVKILRDIADALAFAHEHGIVHRDLKPENVLLVGDHAYLLDFGIALLKQGTTGHRLTGQGVAVGTVGYMAPEQASGGEIGAQADVYAWGVLAREMLTGKSPGPVMKESAGARTGDANAWLYRLVETCLNPDPALRPRDAAILLEKIQAEAPGRAAAPSRAVRRRAWPWAALLLLGGVGGWFVLRPRTPTGLGQLSEPVAVAPFHNETGDSSLATWGRLAGDWITQGLQETGRVRVVPWPAVRDAVAGGNGSNPAERLKRETGAGTVITGSYYLVGDRIRFQAEVVDAAEGTVLAAPEPAVAPRDSVEQAVGVLRARVMGALAIRADREIAQIPGLAERPPTYEAYRAFDRGVQLHLAQRYDSAVVAFRTAFRADTTFGIALLYAAIDQWNTGDMARVDSLLGELRRRDLPLSEYHELLRDNVTAMLMGDGMRALTTIRRASEIAPHARGRYGLGWTAMALHRPTEALAALRTVDPDASGMRGWAPYWTQLSHAYHLTGDHPAELAAVREMRRRHPESTVARVLAVRAAAAMGNAALVDTLLRAAEGTAPDTYWSYGAALVVAGEEYAAHGRAFLAGDMYKRAIRWFANQLTRDPNNRAHRYWIGSALYDAGRWPEARPYFESLAEDYPDRLIYRGLVALGYARAGQLTEAERRLGPRPRYAPGEHTVYRARIAAIAGRNDEAIALLRQAATEGTDGFAWLHASAHRDLSAIGATLARLGE